LNEPVLIQGSSYEHNFISESIYYIGAQGMQDIFFVNAITLEFRPSFLNLTREALEGFARHDESLMLSKHFLFINEHCNIYQNH